MKTKIIIIEDEKQSQEAIIQMIKANCDEIEIVGVANSVETATSLIKKNKCDIILLDINLPDGTAFDILNKIDIKNYKIIFTTAFEKYALKAIKLSAVDYLLKPISSVELVKALQKAKELTQKEHEHLKIAALLNNFENITHNAQKIVLKTAENIYVVNIQNIIRCESDNNYTTVYLNDKRKIVISKSLKEFSNLLEDFSFLRIHRSHLINTNYIIRFEKQQNLVYMQDNSKIQVSQRKKEELTKIFNRMLKL